MHAEQSITPPQAQFLQEQKLQQREDAALFLSSDLFSSKHSGRKTKGKGQAGELWPLIACPVSGQIQNQPLQHKFGFPVFHYVIAIFSSQRIRTKVRNPLEKQNQEQPTSSSTTGNKYSLHCLIFWIQS